VLLGHLHKLQAKYCFGILTEWIDTDANIVSDLLSRFRIQQFEKQVRRMGFSSLVRLQVPDRSSISSQMMSAISP
jgi:hypothetical protein